MSDIRVLEEIGLQEVSRQTHIEIKTLQYMLDKEFDKLGRINTIGFIKIISREYHLDLSEWQEEFEAYWEEKSVQTPSKAEAAFAVNASSVPKRSIFKTKLFLFILIFLIAFGVHYFGIWEKFQPVVVDKISQWTQSEESRSAEPQESVSYITPSVVNEAQKILEEEPVLEVNESALLGGMDFVEESNGTKSDLADEPTEQEPQTQEAQEALTQEANPEPKAQEESTLDNVASSQAKTLSNPEGMILPNVNIWVGVIYLDNKKRDSHLTNQPIKLNLQREQIITTGHGNFTLDINGEKRPFKEELPKRFHWDGKEMKSIDYDEFVILNGGTSW